MAPPGSEHDAGKRMYRRATPVLIAALLAACASAKNPVGNGDVDARGNPDIDARIVIGGHPDAMPIPDAPPGTPDAKPTPDAAPAPDAAPGSVTMRQTTDDSLQLNNSIGCADSFFDTKENSFYRVFKLSDYGVTGALHIQHVDFGVDGATAGITGTQSVTVKLYTYTGTLGANTLDTSKLTPLGSKSVVVPDTDTTEMVTATLAATAPAGSILVAEVLVPDGVNNANYFYVGTNQQTETGPSYIRAPKCLDPSNAPITTPTAISTLGISHPVSVVLTVTGTY
jgi:hypothetical protein